MNEKIRQISDRLTKCFFGPWKNVVLGDDDNYQSRIVSSSGLRVIGNYSDTRDYSNLTHKGTAEFIAKCPEDMQYLLNLVEDMQYSMERLEDLVKILAYDDGECRICSMMLNSKHTPSCLVGKALARKVDNDYSQ